jgi:cytochrome o ubiquinol oxidase subunit I
MQANTNQSAQGREYQPIEMPKRSAIGFINAFFAVVTGFALIWHIWWMAGLGLVGAFVTLLVFAFRDEEEIEISTEQIALFERRHQTEATAL